MEHAERSQTSGASTVRDEIQINLVNTFGVNVPVTFFQSFNSLDFVNNQLSFNNTYQVDRNDSFLSSCGHIVTEDSKSMLNSTDSMPEISDIDDSSEVRLPAR